MPTSTTENLGIVEVVMNQRNPEIPINDAFHQFDQAISGVLAYAVNGGTDVMDVPQRRYNRVDITGILLADQYLEYPAVGKETTVVNKTTGAFDLFFQTDDGATVPLLIPQDGLAYRISSDGVSYIMVSSGSGGGGSSADSHAEISNAGTQSIPNNTDTVITFDTNDLIEGSAITHPTVGGSTDEITVGVTGLYSIIVQVQFDNPVSGVGTGRVYIRINTNIVAASSIPLNISDDTYPPCPTMIKLTSGDIIDVMVKQTSGGALNVVTKIIKVTHIR